MPFGRIAHSTMHLTLQHNTNHAKCKEAMHHFPPLLLRPHHRKLSTLEALTGKIENFWRCRYDRQASFPVGLFRVALSRVLLAQRQNLWFAQITRQVQVGAADTASWGPLLRGKNLASVQEANNSSNPRARPPRRETRCRD